MRISDWSSDVCSSDLALRDGNGGDRAVDVERQRKHYRALFAMAPALARIARRRARQHSRDQIVGPNRPRRGGWRWRRRRDRDRHWRLRGRRWGDHAAQTTERRRGDKSVEEGKLRGSTAA